MSANKSLERGMLLMGMSRERYEKAIRFIQSIADSSVPIAHYKAARELLDELSADPPAKTGILPPINLFPSLPRGRADPSRTRVATSLTEDDVRRIIREEIASLKPSTGAQTS